MTRNAPVWNYSLLIFVHLDIRTKIHHTKYKGWHNNKQKSQTEVLPIKDFENHYELTLIKVP